ncbi:MAG: LptF/LptG family permease [Candidatus Omnitrophica bacterium]|nr:LptF/LptG family permease [Candidatus Omnitrophota bacterium]MCM8827473.1 LptF/LptG family permease [Candidatus Omnitrophota bacterium]
MKILRNYILKDFLSSFFFSLLSLTLVMVLGNLIKVSDMVIRKGVSLTESLKIFSLFIPYILGFTLPLSILLSILLVMGRLIADNELIAINVAGISFTRILIVFAIIGIIFSLTLLILNDKIVPHFHYYYRQHIANIYAKNITAIIEPRVYLDNFTNTIIYVDDVKENKLKNIFIYEIDDKGANKLTYAKSGNFVLDKSILKMKLENGFRDEINPKNKKEFYRLDFQVFFIDIPLQKGEQPEIKKKSSDMNIKEIKDNINHLRKLNIQPTKFLIELHKRISLSFSPLIFTILGFGISLIIRHKEKSINFGVAISIAGLYYLLILLGEIIVTHNLLTPFIGMWAPNILVGAIGISLILKNAHIR